ncbi:MAG TPA: DivIVA domain-containing protein [Gemmatimonadota bacterium]|nr:DivIVA domain-containing protein [Gemmatimonadota bacterium]
MELTPLDVRKKKDDFKRVVRGYEPSQVEAFLEMCGERLDELVQRDKRQQGEIAALRERLTAFEERERALNEALVSAQELREEARAQAEKGADLRLREAEQEAAAIRQRAEAATDAARRTLEELKVRRAGFLRSLRGSLERFLGEIEQEEKRLAAEDDTPATIEGVEPKESGGDVPEHTGAGA